MRTLVVLATLCVLLSGTAFADPVVAVLWRKYEDGWDFKKFVHGIDLATGKEVWTAAFKRPVSFVQAVKDGALVGCDDGTLSLFEQATGKKKWTVEVWPSGKNRPNMFYAEYDLGYLVADNEEHIWFVSKDGKVMWWKK